MATTYSIAPNPASISEGGGTLTFTITRSGTLPAETLFVSTTQTEGFANNGDYNGLFNQLLSFSSGQLSQTVTVSIINDSVTESNETFGLIIQRNSTDPLSTFLAKTTFTIADNDTNLPPVVTGQSNVSFTTNQSFSFTSLISASDLDGSVASYTFFDSTPGAGHLTLDGSQISGTSVTVLASQLSRVGYATGSSVGRDRRNRQ